MRRVYRVAMMPVAQDINLGRRIGRGIWDRRFEVSGGTS